jgi:glycerol-3-phosphate dehydrogenase
VPFPGLVSIAGGKFTTYRLMARDVIDAAVADLTVSDHVADGNDPAVPESVTDQLPLRGADGLPAVRAGIGRLASEYGVPHPAVEHLVDRYGSLAEEVLELTRADPGLAEPLTGGHPYLRAEVAYAVTSEGALHVEDVLVRRVRLFIESADSGTGAAPAVAAIMADLLGWSRRRRAAETRRYLDLVENERTALDELALPLAAGAVKVG